ncbi:S9 family peptidase [Pleionea sediminis]|uniref:S9 family peptidase n=1 Tax=Pleionea sediminis TaxID=2569479 RepID=UPI0013DE4328|nr:prolyl oligopeptidase family serine peptidase [Pleionea sediminis]
MPYFKRIFISIVFIGLLIPAANSAPEISLKKIMSDPEWIGLTPQNPYWAEDQKSVFFQQKIPGHQATQLMQLNLQNQSVTPVPLEQLDSTEVAQRVYNQDRSLAAYVYQGDVYVMNLASNEVRPVTQTLDAESQVLFLVDGRVAFRRGMAFFAYDLTSGRMAQLAQVELNSEPEDWQEPDDFLGQQQRRLFKYIKEEQDKRQFNKNRSDAIDKANQYLTAKTFYLGDKQVLKHLVLSPDGQRIFAATSDEKSGSGKNDNMPRFVTEDGYVENESVRILVGQEQPDNEAFFILDLNSGETQPLSIDELDGIDDDPLENLKETTAKAKGEKFKSEESNRHVYLHNWFGNGVVWSNDGSRLALNVFSYDNKDRWLARVNFKKKELVTLHRLTDDAWVNDWTFNQMGWLNDNETFYFISEESGYAHLYLKRRGDSPEQITDGNFEVSDLTVSQNDEFIYFRANKKHPGIYEVYRVNLKSEKIEPVTDMGGNNDYVLSPDESKLVVTHSTLTQPPELYVMSLKDRKPSQITQTVSEEFSSINWTKPQIIEVPSSNTDAPIYSRLYLPESFDANRSEAYPAVVFVHGAGYLQNAHQGWSGYFREFMFHTFLNRKGYVVLDMDYRASKGYGRDWRTAIYQRMGTPELEDLLDGKQWIVKNANVNPNKVGVYGGSYGGFMAFMSLFKAPGEFAAGAALRPVTDWSSYNHGYTSNILNTPEVDPEAYNRSSPIEFAEGLQDPLLIAHGMVDDNVFFKDSVRLVQRLIELEKTPLFEMAVYPIEPHGFRTPSSWLDEYTRIFLLFENNVK